MSNCDSFFCREQQKSSAKGCELFSSPLTENVLDDETAQFVSLSKFLTSSDLSSNSNLDPSLCMTYFLLSVSELQSHRNQLSNSRPVPTQFSTPKLYNKKNVEKRMRKKMPNCNRKQKSIWNRFAWACSHDRKIGPY